MKRTQIYLEDGQYEALKRRARRESKSLAALIRECVTDFLYPGTRPEQSDSLGAVIGLGKGDGSRVAERVDDYLYGES